MNRAIFFDKDGVINSDKGISGNFEPVELYPEIAVLMAEFRIRGYRIFVVTNQPVVARGLMSEAELEEYLGKFEKLILEKNSGAIIDKIYYCPHHPNANIEKYRVRCECRKPRPGMILKAAEEFALNLNESFMIGDRISDIISGSLAGCKTVHFLSGMHMEKTIETDLKIEKEISPDYKITDLNELREIIR